MGAPRPGCGVGSRQEARYRRLSVLPLHTLTLEMPLRLLALALLALGCCCGGGHASPPPPWSPASAPLTTPWTADVTPTAARPEHPRPMLTRGESSWQSLNGLWEVDYERGPGALDAPPPRTTLPHQILVPFPLESALGGLRAQAPNFTTIYRRVFPKGAVLPRCGAGMRRLLHFEKVDWNSTVWVNGERVCSHVGGYDPFSCPLPEADAALEIAVGVVDYTELNPRHWQPRGKQVRSAFTVPSGMMYTGSSGIWDSVWAECVPRSGFVAAVNAQSTGAPNASVVFEVELGGTNAAETKVCIEVFDGNRSLGSPSCVTPALRQASSPATATAIIAMPDDAKLWSPDHPFLYNATVTLHAGGSVDAEGAALDEAHTYFGHRTVSTGMVDGVPRVLLNGKPYYLIGPLDQGWFPDGLYTAATDAALRSDLLAMKKMGMNSVSATACDESSR